MVVTEIIKAVSGPIINGLISILKDYSSKDQSEPDIEINIESHVKPEFPIKCNDESR